MKIKLLNDGGYGDMENVKFPVIVTAEGDGSIFLVTAHELYRVGANNGQFDDLPAWAFACDEIEVIHES